MTFGSYVNAQGEREHRGNGSHTSSLLPLFLSAYHTAALCSLSWLAVSIVIVSVFFLLTFSDGS